MDQKRLATSAATCTSKEEKLEAKAMDALTRVEGEIDDQLLSRIDVDERREAEFE